MGLFSPNSMFIQHYLPILFLLKIWVPALCKIFFKAIYDCTCLLCEPHGSGHFETRAYLKSHRLAMVGWLSWLECHRVVHQKVCKFNFRSGHIPRLWACRGGNWWMCLSYIHVSLCLSLCLPSSLSKLKHMLRWRLKKITHIS